MCVFGLARAWEAVLIRLVGQAKKDLERGLKSMAGEKEEGIGCVPVWLDDKVHSSASDRGTVVGAHLTPVAQTFTRACARLTSGR